MKVILTQEVKGLGKKGDMVEASDGHARNYLMPKGLAVEANAANVNIMNNRKAAEKSKKDRELAQARQLAEKLNGKTVTMKVKAGDTGKLFGSITSKDIVDAIKAQLGIEIDKKKLVLPEVIRSIGTVEADVKLYPEVSAKINVKIVQE